MTTLTIRSLCHVPYALFWARHRLRDTQTQVSSTPPTRRTFNSPSIHQRIPGSQRCKHVFQCNPHYPLLFHHPLCDRRRTHQLCSETVVRMEHPCFIASRCYRRRVHLICIPPHPSLLLLTGVQPSWRHKDNEDLTTIHYFHCALCISRAAPGYGWKGTAGKGVVSERLGLCGDQL